MAYGRRVVFEDVREIAFGAVGANYTAVGGALTDHARLVFVTSTLDAEVYLSLDGVNDHQRYPANFHKTLDLTANKVRDDGFFVPQGTIFYVKRVAGAPTSGALWIEVITAGGGV